MTRAQAQPADSSTASSDGGTFSGVACGARTRTIYPVRKENAVRKLYIAFMFALLALLSIASTVAPVAEEQWCAACGDEVASPDDGGYVGPF